MQARDLLRCKVVNLVRETRLERTVGEVYRGIRQEFLEILQNHNLSKKLLDVWYFEEFPGDECKSE